MLSIFPRAVMKNDWCLIIGREDEGDDKTSLDALSMHSLSITTGLMDASSSCSHIFRPTIESWSVYILEQKRMCLSRPVRILQMILCFCEEVPRNTATSSPPSSF
eukprot:TRINITY_DN5948_c0_g2_i1.p1 TRINITY_DN5948_c0_g2~~TRINITY_DN5948_c0_g2_i1.p1  ORF type:complete len:105 (-),score=19.09 TRINITY_DN5948_c0_g2_i1:169-483(-)